MGLRVVFMNGGGIVLTLLVGSLAKSYWKNIYLLFLLCIPVALICLFLLPKGRIEKAPNEEKGEKVGFVKKYMNKWLLSILVMVVIQGIGYSCYLSNNNICYPGFRDWRNRSSKLCFHLYADGKHRSRFPDGMVCLFV